MKTQEKRKYKKIFKYFTICLCVVLFRVGSNTCLASENNFYDFVQEERRKEILKSIETEEAGSTDATNKNSRLLYGRLISVLLTLIGAGVVYCSKRRYGTPYNVSNIELLKKEAESLIFTMRPIEVSAIVNINEFSKYDLIATVFDLMRRNILYIDAPAQTEDKTIIYLNKEQLANSEEQIENYEDFLIGWLFRKIGTDGCFSFDELGEYLSLDSRAAEFDIDYDIWLDELSEHVKDRDIKDSLTESWKLFCAIFGLGYALLGMVLLYTTNSVLSFLLFAITFVSYFASNKVVRRSKETETAYSFIMGLKERMNEEINSAESFEDEAKWDLYFAYGIPLENVELILTKYKKHEKLYYLLETGLDKAIAYASDVMSSSLKNI